MATTRFVRIVLFLGCIMLFLLGCSATPEETELSENDIFVIDHYSNNAWGYRNHGCFATMSGNVYTYCFDLDYCWRNSEESDEELLTRLNVIKQYSNPIATIDVDKIEEAYKKGMALNPNAGYIEFPVGEDAGNKTLFLCRKDSQSFLACRTRGDSSGQLTGIKGSSFLNFYSNNIEPVFETAIEDSRNSDYKDNHYYGVEDVYFANVHCGYTGLNGKYVVTNEEECENLALLTNANTGVTEQYADGRGEKFLYFIEFIDVESADCQMQADGILCTEGAFEFVPAASNIWQTESQTVSDAQDGFCYVAAFPRYLADCYVREGGSYYDLDGDEWERP